jgi:hypothetical protein
MNDESLWKAVNRMETAAENFQRNVDRFEDAVRRLSYMVEDGYGGNVPRLIEALERVDATQKESNG